jgi:hypothetical protein
VIGPDLRRVSAPAAAFANGAFAHAFEYDNLRQPSIGVHPGATVLVGGVGGGRSSPRVWKGFDHGLGRRLRVHVPDRTGGKKQ